MASDRVRDSGQETQGHPSDNSAPKAASTLQDWSDAPGSRAPNALSPFRTAQPQHPGVNVGWARPPVAWRVRG